MHPKALGIAAAIALSLPAVSVRADVVVMSHAPLPENVASPVETVSKEIVMQVPVNRSVDEILTMTPGIGTPLPEPGSVPGVDTIRYKVDGSGSRPTFPPGTTIDFGDGKALHFPSLYTFRFNGPTAGMHIIVRRPGESKPAIDQTVRIPSVQLRDFGTLAPPNRFETPPIAVTGRTSVVRGALSGDGTKTKITIGGKPVRIIAENQRSVFFQLPDDAPAGYTKVVIEDGGRRAEIPIAVLTLSMSADRLKLKRGQTTKFHVTIAGPESWTDETWKAGVPADLCDVGETRKKFPGFEPPAPGGDGFLMLSITNLSPGVISMQEFAKRLGKADFRSGSYQYDGGIGAVNDGGFGIHGEVQAFIAPASAEASTAENK